MLFGFIFVLHFSETKYNLVLCNHIQHSDEIVNPMLIVVAKWSKKNQAK